MKRTGVVVVTYNSAGVIERCLDSCATLDDIVVVDNASADKTVDLVRKHPSVKLIANTENRGFAAAANQGVTALDTELVLLLNPDIEIQTSLGALVAACSEGDGAIATGRLVDLAGQPQTGFNLRRFPSAVTLAFEVLGLNRLMPWNPANRHYRCLDVDLSKPAEVEQPPGAFLMFRRQVWQQLGGFDTQFHPIWFEDVDFLKRAHQEGLKIQYRPEVTAFHRGGHSIAGLDWGCREVCWYVSLLKYASKHFRPYAFRGVSAAVVLGSMIRAVTGLLQRRSWEPLRVYVKVARLGCRSLVYGRIDGIECFNSYSKAAG